MSATGSDSDPLPPLDVKYFREPFPCDDVVLRVQNQLKHADTVAQECDAEILHGLPNATSLQERRDRIRCRMDEYRSYISPIRRIPIEIWIDIFSLSLCDSTSLCIAKTGVQTPTLYLSHVCSFWRAVVISVPRLWTHLDVCLGDEHSGPDAVDILNLYLQRSGMSPLRVNFRDWGMRGDLCPVGWDMLRMLLEASNRWLTASCYLHWNIANHNKVKDFLKTVQSRCEILERLCIHFGPFPPKELFVSPHLFEFMARAPRLQVVRLSIFDPVLSLPYFQLQEITVDGKFSQMLHCLPMCPNLQKAKINIVPPDVIEDVIDICLPHLYSLTCNFGKRAGRRAEIFSCLTLPALRELNIWDTGGEVGALSDSVHALISRSGCQLDTLKLDIYGLSDRELVWILSMTPMLTSLELGFLPFHSFTASFCQNLTLCYPQPAGGNALVPRLTSLEIKLDEPWCHPEPITCLPSPEVILAMVKSRRRPAIELEGLKVFTLGLDYYYSAPLFHDWVKSLFIRVAEPDIRALAGDGLKIKLEFSM